MANEPIPSEVQIFVSEESGDPRTLRFRASATDPRLGFGTFVDYGATVLRMDPGRYLDGLFDQLQIAGVDVFGRLEDAGVRLFEELLPFELRRRLWRARSDIRTLFVVSAEAWIPWELLKLQDPEGEAIGPFFAEAFDMGRWLSTGAKSAASLYLPLRKIGLIIPGNSGLPAAKVERQQLLGLGGASREVVEVAAAKADVVAAMAEGTYEGWHFCGHGSVGEDVVEPWYLQLETDSFDPNQLHGRARRLGLGRPMVFLNACHGGRGGDNLASVSGLPASFLRVGAGAFIGALWQVSDDGAALFARVLYGSFLSGSPLGAAIRAARLEIHRAFPDDPTWLAYIFLGNPAALCRLEDPAGGRAPVFAPVEVEAVRSGLAAGPAPVARAAAPRSAARGGRDVRARQVPAKLRWASLGIVLLLLAGVAASYWRVPTLVRLEGRATGFSAWLAGGAVLLDEGATFRRLSLTQPGALELASGLSGRVTPIEVGAGDFLTVSSPATAGSVGGTLPRLRLAAGERMAIQAEKLRGAVGLRIEGTAAEPPYEIVLPAPFQLQTAQASVPGVEGAEASRLQVFPGPEGMILEVDLPADGAGEARHRLLDRTVELADLGFTERRAADDSLRSTLSELKVSYPDIPARAPVLLGRDGGLVVAEHDLFRLTSLELDMEKGDLCFAFEGRASRLLAGAPGNLADLRLTIWASTSSEAAFFLGAMATIALGVGAYRFLMRQKFFPARAGEEPVR